MIQPLGLFKPQNPPVGIIHYGTSAPPTVKNVTGAVSPLGWPLNFFDDFTSFTNSPSTNTCTTGAMYPFGSETLATYATNLGGSEGNTWSPTAVTQSGSQVHFNATWNGGGGSILSGSLNSYLFMGSGGSNANVQTGYWEASIKFANGANGVSDGFWGAWWMLGTNEWPPEMDIIEQNSSTPTTMNATLHYTADNTSDGGSFQDLSLPNGASILDGFHTYGGLITPKYIAWYCDGVLMAQTAPGFAGFGNNINLFNNTAGNGMSFILNFSVAPGESGQIAQEAQFPATMSVDWVRYSLLGPA